MCVGGGWRNCFADCRCGCRMNKVQRRREIPPLRSDDRKAHSRDWPQVNSGRGRPEWDLSYEVEVRAIGRYSRPASDSYKNTHEVSCIVVAAKARTRFYFAGRSFSKAASSRIGTPRV